MKNPFRKKELAPVPMSSLLQTDGKVWVEVDDIGICLKSQMLTAGPIDVDFVTTMRLSSDMAESLGKELVEMAKKCSLAA